MQPALNCSKLFALVSDGLGAGRHLRSEPSFKLRPCLGSQLTDANSRMQPDSDSSSPSPLPFTVPCCLLLAR